MAADQAGKAWAVHRFSGGRAPLALGFVRLELSRNPGAAFGLGRGLTVWITVVAAVAVLALGYAGLRATRPHWAVAIGLMEAGALGNLVDRFTRSPGFGRGAVVDWIKLPFYGPVFNLADVMLRAGALITIGLLLGAGRRAASRAAAI